MAREQTAGRGRQGRPWHSGDGNLFLSIVLWEREVARAAQLSPLVAVALAEALAPMLPEKSPPLRLKWPNDVLVGGRKLAGILLESHSLPQGLAVIVGVGVNVLWHPQEGTAYGATALRAAGSDADRMTVLEAFALRLHDRVQVWRQDGFAPVRAAWLERAAGLGEAVVVHMPGETFTGRLRGMDAQGGLVVDADTGRRVAMAGTVRFMDEQGGGDAAGH